jgi:hypothetical protein
MKTSFRAFQIASAAKYWRKIGHVGSAGPTKILHSTAVRKDLWNGTGGDHDVPSYEATRGAIAEANCNPMASR